MYRQGRIFVESRFYKLQFLIANPLPANPLKFLKNGLFYIRHKKGKSFNFHISSPAYKAFGTKLDTLFKKHDSLNQKSQNNTTNFALFYKKIKIHAQTPKYTPFQRLTFLQIIPYSTFQTPFNPLHTLITKYTNQRTARHFKHKANPNPKAQKRRIAFLHLQFFLTKIPNLCKLFHNPRKTNHFKKQKTKTPKSPSHHFKCGRSVGGVWGNEKQ